MDDAIRRDSESKRRANEPEADDPRARDLGDPDIDGGIGSDRGMGRDASAADGEFLLGELSSCPPDVEFERTYEKRMRSFETRPEGPPPGYPRAKEIAILAIHERRVAGGADLDRPVAPATGATPRNGAEGESC